ncbi:hypothetical protein HN954_01055 [bacterium]|jgi:DNA repair protein RecO|nr:hypothetical protein [bacterium]MBT6831792.1 hypothetical protein [bacterium]MBT6995999.1 hypothetical protein [bacterium]MBT7772630.1 hypothetical protein [bacterium]
MGEQKTLAILLRRTLLASDDAALEFFTPEWGKITIFVKKFSRSKKRADLDFFRLLELEIFQGRNSKTLRNVNTQALFHGFSKSFAASEFGFFSLSRIAKNFEESPQPEIFSEIIKLFSAFEPSQLEIFDLFFRGKMLVWSGTFPKMSGKFFEFFRRATVDEFLENRENFSPEILLEIRELIEKTESFCE